LRNAYSTAGAYRLENLLRGFTRIVVRPKSQHDPSRLTEPSVRVGIAPTVLFELLKPPFPVGLWDRAVFWAAVPKATVDIDRDPLTREDDVGPAPRSVHRSIDEVTKAQSMQFGSQRQFGASITPLCPSHPSADRL
jgi:hypothetical protein